MLVADEREDSESLEKRLPRETARHYVIRVTALKAGAAVVRHQRRQLSFAPILVADTTVALGRSILGKPQSADEAIEMLSRLSASRHRVLTAVALTDGKRLLWDLSESWVTMRALGAREIRSYVASKEPFGKAGAYAIQGRAAQFVSHIAGSFTGIVGLPLFETSRLLHAFRVRS
jgi:septum formation protein